MPGDAMPRRSIPTRVWILYTDRGTCEGSLADCYPNCGNGTGSNFKIPRPIAILAVFRGHEEPYAHLREFFSIADTYQLAEEVHKRGAGKLPSYPALNPKHKPGGPEHVNIVTSLRNGKTYNNDIKIPSVHDFSHDVEDFVTGDEVHYNSLPRALENGASARLDKMGPHLMRIYGRLSASKINRPLIDAIKKFLHLLSFYKDLCTQKRKLKATLPKKIDLTEHVSAVLSTSLPLKFKDPRAPLISVMVGNIAIKNRRSLALGAKDVIVKVDDFYYPVDFFVMDTESPYQDVQPTIILGRPFLATIDARINCRTGAKDIAFGNRKLRLNVFNSLNSPTLNDCYHIDTINECIQTHTQSMKLDHTLEYLHCVDSEKELFDG
ncbi:hypothetical protein Tco_0223483 [Tanacetum coccineum]